MMKDPGRHARWLSLMIAGLIMAGCGQSKISGPAAADVRQVSSPGAPAELVAQLGEEIAAARSAQFDLLSPERFKRAQDAFERARQDLEKGNEIAGIQANISESRAYLDKAQAIASISRSTLADTLEARDMARQAGATQFEKDYRRVENNFLDLTRAIEKGKFSDAGKNSDRVAEQYRELEVRAIKEDTIGAVRAQIAKAEGANARKIAPTVYEQAVSRLAAADDFISANPYATDVMQTMAEDALFQANRLAVVTALGNRVKTMPPEDIVLLVEDHLQTIATALGARDMRDQDYRTQIDNIIGSVEALKADRDFIAGKNASLQTQMAALTVDYQARIDALNVHVAMLEGKTREDQMAKERLARERLAVEQRLAAERKFNQLYATVQDYFAADEAEVYKQENQLVVRLKAMRFPVGKSIIMPENYGLLSKVQKAIRSFDDPRVIIEGHTDTTGSDEVNTLLSQQRADAVRDYLIANQTLSPESIAAVGYGSERPLASNTTPAGRAINRRIDILIIPRANPI